MSQEPLVAACKCGLAYTVEQFQTLPLAQRFTFTKGTTGLPDFEYRTCVCGAELGVQLAPWEPLPQAPPERYCPGDGRCGSTGCAHNP